MSFRTAISAFVLAALGLSGCEVEPPQACVEPEAAWVDQDVDGYIRKDDCRDRNELVHPAAFDACDGIDNDCDGEVDEGYPDVDGDGEADCRTSDTCDGLDNDGDGLIDEGYDDFDGDGIADCLDDQCDTTPLGVTEIEVDEDCSKPVVIVKDPYDLKIEWQVSLASSGDRGVIIMPAIANLSDDNGDGRIDTSDTPDIAFIGWSFGVVEAWSGDGSKQLWSWSGADGNSSLMIADVDNDNEPEVIVLTPGDQVVALDHNGKVEWTSSRLSAPSLHSTPIAADLEGDGDVEIIFDTTILNGSDGSIQATLSDPGVSWRTPVAADLDADGIQEVMLGLNVYSPTGSVLWSVSTVGTGDSAFQAVADIDGDAGGESFFVHGQEAYVMDDDGSLITSFSLPGANSRRPGPPSIADFDGDGDVEIVIPANTQIHMFETNGTRVWSQTMQDNSGIAGASGYDIDGDGVYEVMFADETHFRIYDGAAGTIHYESGAHTSGTVFEYPTIADVDADGSTEVVIASNTFGAGGWAGITVFGHAGSGWAESGPTWPVHDFCVTNINPDGTVPVSPPTPWSVHNVFRARPVVDDVSLDLGVEIVDACASSCMAGIGILAVEVQVWNAGGLPASGTIPVSLWADNAGVLTLIETQDLDGVDGGSTAPTMHFDVPIEDVGTDGLVVRVDDRGDDPLEISSKYTECFEDNNVDTFPYDVCGP
mgnify:CR=1 FL=1